MYLYTVRVLLNPYNQFVIEVYKDLEPNSLDILYTVES